MSATHVFVVGSSRSGTTLMARMLGRTNEIHTLGELHLFDELVPPNSPEIADAQRAERLLAILTAIEREGYFARRHHRRHRAEARALLSHIGAPFRVVDLVGEFLRSETTASGKRIPCEHTPGTVFALARLFDWFPRARVIAMVRDPRDVLLSQKLRWRRRALSGGRTPRRQALKNWAAYSPLAASIAWRRGAEQMTRWAQDPRVDLVRFEDLVTDPESVSRRVLAGIGLSFDKGALDVPRVGSSHQHDDESARGVDVTRVGGWRGGLSPSEVWISDRINGAVARGFGYEPRCLERPSPGVAVAMLMAVLKLPLGVAVAPARFRRVLR